MIRFDAETDTFVACWLPLRVYAQGRTEEEAAKALTSALFMYLKILHKNPGAWKFRWMKVMLN